MRAARAYFGNDGEAMKRDDSNFEPDPEPNEFRVSCDNYPGPAGRSTWGDTPRGYARLAVEMANSPAIHWYGRIVAWWERLVR